jgi:hypothetical protein
MQTPHRHRQNWEQCPKDEHEIENWDKHCQQKPNNELTQGEEPVLLATGSSRELCVFL